MIEQLVAAVDAVLPNDSLTTSQRVRMTEAFARVLDVKPVQQVCEAIDQLKQRGLGVSVVKCGGLELQIHQLHTPGKTGPVEDDLGEDDPIFDGVR